MIAYLTVQAVYISCKRNKKMTIKLNWHPNHCFTFTGFIRCWETMRNSAMPALRLLRVVEGKGFDIAEMLTFNLQKGLEVKW